METTDEPDWRAEQLLEKDYLVGVRFQWRRHSAYREGWDHDHCVGCWATFSEHEGAEPGEEPILREGFTTFADFENGAEYWWICPDCWTTFKDAMKWTQVATEAPRPPDRQA